jgi:nucleotide-binding universal stress UspA family protein
MLKNMAVAGDIGPETSRLQPGLTGPLLVNAGEQSLLGGPLRLAEALARRDQVHVHVLKVVRPLPSLVSLGATLATDLTPDDLDDWRRELAAARLLASVTEHVGLPAFFSTSAKLGSPVRTIVAEARAAAAAYVLSDLPPLGTSGRRAAAIRTQRIATAADTPVLAVSADVHLLPRSALAAVDLGEASLRAVRLALPLLDDGASLTLAHVVPEVEFVPPGGKALVEAGVQGALNLLRGVADEVGATSNARLHLIVLQGEPAEVLAQWLPRFDLVALGAIRRSGLDLAPGGSVSAAAFRQARGAVLVAGGG